MKRAALACMIGCGCGLTAPDATVPPDASSKDALAEAAADTSVEMTPCGPRPAGIFSCCGATACRGWCDAGACDCGLALGGCPPPTACCPNPIGSQYGCQSEAKCQ